MSEQQPNPYQNATREPGSPGHVNGAAVAMLIVGILMVVFGGYTAYMGWRVVEAFRRNVGPLGAFLQPDYTQVYAGLALAAVGVVLLIIVWALAAARKPK